jgi:hypothetical protein
MADTSLPSVCFDTEKYSLVSKYLITNIFQERELNNVDALQVNNPSLDKFYYSY